MADPRYRNGIHQSFRTRPRVALDCPQNHGWVKTGVSVNGYDIFAHPDIQKVAMRAGTPKEGYDWLVAKEGQAVYGINGALADLTKDILAEFIPFDGRPGDPGGDPDRDDYGLEAVA